MVSVGPVHSWSPSSPFQRTLGIQEYSEPWWLQPAVISFLSSNEGITLKIDRRLAGSPRTVTGIRLLIKLAVSRAVNSNRSPLLRRECEVNCNSRTKNLLQQFGSFFRTLPHVVSHFPSVRIDVQEFRLEFPSHRTCSSSCGAFINSTPAPSNTSRNPAKDSYG